MWPCDHIRENPLIKERPRDRSNDGLPRFRGPSAYFRRRGPRSCAPAPSSLGSSRAAAKSLRCVHALHSHRTAAVPPRAHRTAACLHSHPSHGVHTWPSHSTLLARGSRPCACRSGRDRRSSRPRPSGSGFAGALAPRAAPPRRLPASRSRPRPCPCPCRHATPPRPVEQRLIEQQRRMTMAVSLRVLDCLVA